MLRNHINRSTAGLARMYEGERWRTVTSAPSLTRLGRRVIVVAPDPIMTTFLPLTSTLEGQN